jgi:histidine triad (HIT) family protein
MSTIFTKIIQKKVPGYLLYEDNLVFAFLDITQATKGHTLVATKKEYRDILVVPEDIFAHLFKVVHQISKVLMDAFQAHGINLLNNNGEVAGQTIFHYHVHLIPRFHEKEINFVFKNNVYLMLPQDYEKIQKAILGHLKKNKIYCLENIK